MATRKSLSKKTRFEVFKRDEFRCFYCGATPPSVILHIDHINPVAAGGGNDMDNLITACQGCNSGKGATPLSDIPASLADRAAEIKEREAQIVGYNKVMQARRKRLELESWQVVAVLLNNPDIDSYNRRNLASIKRFLEQLSFDEVLDAAYIAAERKSIGSVSGFKYFCGICWKLIRG